MPVYDAPLEPGGAEGDLDEEVVGSEKVPLSGSALGSTPPRWLILKRGRQHMALFLGWPEAGMLEACQKLGMTIGLALTADDFAAQRLIEGCGYVFIGADHRRAAVFATALRDLARANWSIDRDASRLVQDASCSAQDASWSVQNASWLVILPVATGRKPRPIGGNHDLPSSKTVESGESSRGWRHK